MPFADHVVTIAVGAQHALPVSIAGAAAVAPARHRSWFGQSHPPHLLGAIAQAFEAVRCPILPKITQLENEAARREILEIRHSSLYAPRDFDISPYFKIVKPILEEGFDYKRVPWADLPAPSHPV